MLRRICDKCGSEIHKGDPWFKMECIAAKSEYITNKNYANFEFCKGCFNNFTEQLANKN